MKSDQLVVLSLAFLTGVCLLQVMTDLPSNTLMIFLGVIAIATMLHRHSRWLAFALSGVLWASIYADSYLSKIPDDNIAGKNILIKGKVIALPVNNHTASRFMFELEQFESQTYQGVRPQTVRLSWYYPDQQVLPGQRWQFEVRLKPPNGFYNPGGFDYEGWLFQHDIQATGYVKKSAKNMLLASSQSPVNLHQIRYHIRENLNSLLPPATARLLTALAIGDRSQMTSDDWQMFIRTGTSHLIAISGLHIGLVAGFCWLFMRQISRFPVLSYLGHRRVILLTSFAFAALYAALAGFTIPTQRALVMLAVVYCGLYFYRQVSVSHSLAMALLLVLIISPVSVLSAGFWLSFLAVAVIAYSVTGRLPGRQKLLKWFWPQLVVVTGLVPITLYYFQQTAVLALFANLVAIPVISLIVLPLLLLSIATMSVSIQLAAGIVSLASFALALLSSLLAWISSLAFAVWIMPSPELIVLILAVLALIILFMPYALPGRWFSILLLLPLISVASDARYQLPEGAFEAHVLDVGQGLSIVIRTQQHSLLFDAGAKFSRRFDVGERVVVPFLTSQALTTLDTFIVSNGDRDHIGGAEAVLKAIQVEKLIGRDISTLEHSNKQLCQRGQKWHWDGVMFEIMHPDSELYSRRNDYSCVLRISNDYHSILLPADIEKTAEFSLTAVFDKKLQADVLIAPHHGSKTSSTQSFIDSVRPEFVIYPAGHLNRYHFPHKSVVERYRQLASQQIKTADSGHLKLHFPGSEKTIDITSYRHSRRRYWHRQTPDPAMSR